MKLPRLTERTQHACSRDHTPETAAVAPQGCGVFKAIGCGAAVIACGAVCVGTGGTACAACFAGLGMGSCIECL